MSCRKMGSRRLSGSTMAPSLCRAIWICGPYQRGVTPAFSRPGRPTDNAFIETFNGHFGAEYLNTIGS